MSGDDPAMQALYAAARLYLDAIPGPYEAVQPSPGAPWAIRSLADFSPQTEKEIIDRATVDWTTGQAVRRKAVQPVKNEIVAFGITEGTARFLAAAANAAMELAKRKW